MSETIKKTIAVLGATGSVGRQALDVAEKRGYRVDLLTANRSVDETEMLVRKFMPVACAMADGDAAKDLAGRLTDTPVRIYAGESGICEAIAASSAETVVNAILGEAGLLPTLAVIRSGKRLALANKESLVIAGEIVMREAEAHGTELLPVDSEHSAIFQSLLAGKHSEIRKILLTASGGPFFGKTKEELQSVTLADTLAHPTWKMGKKITVDSATLMNKGFEVIEASHLFGVPADRIEVVVHRESILHSAVEYIDGSVIGEFAVPDMRMCVQYAVDYPNREPSVAEALDLFRIGSLTFRKPDTETFPLLSLARDAMLAGGGTCAALNAADEVAVSAFLSGKLAFCRIARAVEETLSRLPSAKNAKDLESILAVDREARCIASDLCRKAAFADH